MIIRIRRATFGICIYRATGGIIKHGKYKRAAYSPGLGPIRALDPIEPDGNYAIAFAGGASQIGGKTEEWVGQ
ncbi:hypothetical protein GCM10007415_40200 [Parapedobacter pyrenivorans]|uniref:Uncharacterized protein n=1 Tax=Parapedobacter pyrenivorans TaxID=1305674 RepID=A0A917MEH6_9SPHI|nr:hypothetical protein GCM10007415_40200 [Parapedobacter pyrenivorans]